MATYSCTAGGNAVLENLSIMLSSFIPLKQHSYWNIMIVYIINRIMLKKTDNFSSTTWSSDYRIMPEIMLA